MNYVLAVVTQFNQGFAEVMIKARGKAITRAVDVAEIVRHRFVPSHYVDITLDTEKLTSEDGQTANVSSIEILLRQEP